MAASSRVGEICGRSDRQALSQKPNTRITTNGLDGEFEGFIRQTFPLQVAKIETDARQWVKSIRSLADNSIISFPCAAKERIQ